MENTVEKQVRVIVLGNSEGEVCKIGWGPRRSSEETTRRAKVYLQRMFGGQIDMAYYDMALPEVQSQFDHIAREAEDHCWPYPLVLMDDQIVIAGDVNVYRLSALVQRALQSGSLEHWTRLWFPYQVGGE